MKDTKDIEFVRQTIGQRSLNSASAYVTHMDDEECQNRDGLLGRFSAQPTADPYNLGCAGGPRSIKVLSQSKSSEQDSVREITGHDGVKGSSR